MNEWKLVSVSIFLVEKSKRNLEGVCKMNDLQMITQEELTKLFHCSEAHVTFLRELGIIPAMRPRNK